MGAIIKETCEEHFGTAYQTSKQPVKPYSSITLQDVTNYLSKRTDIQVKYKPRTYNNCVFGVLHLNMQLTFWIWNQKVLLLMPDMVLLRLITLPRLPR